MKVFRHRVPPENSVAVDSSALTIIAETLSPRIIPSRRCGKDLRRVAIGGFFRYQGRMNTVLNVCKNLWSTLGCVGELLGYLLRFVSALFRTRASLVTRHFPAASSQERSGFSCRLCSGFRRRLRG
ncbi:MAG: hypothetical protein NTV86_13755 [Planctomycetota bacterium]|nr:hypothetical protein [Planctomycetota bacterium]